MTQDQLKKLADPAHHRAIGVEVKWRVGDKAGQGQNVIFPYYTAEQCREILDDVCGITSWTSEFREVAGYLFCSIGIYIDDKLIEKADAGGARKSTKGLTDADKETFEAKTAASSSFVRASKAWGIGRHIDFLPQIILPTQSFKAINPETNEVLQGDALTAYCNQSSTAEGYLYAIYRQRPELFTQNERAMEIMKELKELVK